MVKQPFDMLGRQYALPEVRRIGLDRPAAWLARGWHDLFANPVPSLAYGLLFSIGGDFILVASVHKPHLFMVAVSGFFLVAPLLAAGLYELSRRNAAGARPTFIDSLAGLGQGAPAIALFGALVAVITLLWERISAMAYALAGQADADIAHFISRIVLDGEHRAFFAAWFFLGALLALLTFAISMVSVQMLLDRNCSVATAILTSLRAFAVNLEAMVLWAAMIVALTVLGFATLLVGLVFIMPVLGHASWHAYRELVK